MAAPLYVSGSAASAHFTAVSVTAPASIVSGNLLLAFANQSSGSTSTITPPSGWTLSYSTGELASCQMWVYYKYATGSEPGSYSWSFSNNFGAVAILQYSGAATSSPVDAISVADGLGLSTWSTTALTSTAADDLLSVGVGDYNGYTFSAPSGMATLVSSAQGGGPGIATFDIALGAAGSYGPYSAAINGSDEWISVAVAIYAGAAAPTFLPPPPYIANQAPQRAATW